MAHFVVFGAILLRPKKKQIGAQKNKKGHAPPKSGPKLKGGRLDHSPPKTANASARLAWNRRSAAWYGALKVRSGEMLPFFARRLLLLMMINVISQHLPGCGDAFEVCLCTGSTHELGVTKMTAVFALLYSLTGIARPSRCPGPHRQGETGRPCSWTSRSEMSQRM